MRAQFNEMYQEISQKVADYENFISECRKEIEDKVSISELNEMLNTKANKPTVAQALHRKANKEEIDDLLSKKVDIEDFNRVLSKLNEKVSNNDINHILSQLEAKVDRHELHDLNLGAAGRSTESVESNWFNALAKDRQIYNSRIENVELDLRESISTLENELKDVIDSFNSGLAKKADYRDLDSLNSGLLNKADIDMISDMLSDLKGQVFDKIKLTKTELAQARKELSEDLYERYNKQNQKLEKITKDIKIAKENTKEINSEASQIRADVKEIIIKEAENISTSVREEINKAIDQWQCDRLKLENELSQKVKKSDLIDFKNDVNIRLDSKVELSEVQNALNSLQSEIANRLINTKAELQNNINDTQEYLKHHLKRKWDLEDVQAELANKIDSQQIRQLLESRASKSEFDALRDTIDRVIREVDSKAASKELDGHIEFTRSSIEDMTKELMQKAKSRDLLNLVEEKASREELERICQTIQKDVSERVSKREIKASLDEQALINEALCSENWLGRWVWKSGELKSSWLIPWEVQCVNTMPDNFVWEKNKTSIIWVAPGLYEVGMGFYSKKDPNVQVQVNGDPIITLSKNSESVEKYVGKHPAGNIIGLTHQDYISLPARARISFIFDGTQKAEGFVSLKKL